MYNIWVCKSFRWVLRLVLPVTHVPQRGDCGWLCTISSVWKFPKRDRLPPPDLRLTRKSLRASSPDPRHRVDTVGVRRLGKLVFPFLDRDGAFQQEGTEQYLEEAWEDIALDSSLASWGRDMREAKDAAFPICHTKSNQ